MVHRRVVRAFGASLAGAMCLSAWLQAAPGDATVAEAAMKKDTPGVRALLKQGADVNASQGDGMTALHWAALNADRELAEMLLYAGANVRATTRLGGYTPLHLASKGGATPVVDAIVKGGGNVNGATSTGATPLMLAAASGSTETVARLLDHGADTNAVEAAQGETALMFAAALDRSAVVRVLLERGANAALTTKVTDISGLNAPGDVALRKASERPAEGGGRAAAPMPTRETPAPAPAAGGKPDANDVPGFSRGFSYNELIGKQGGLSALHFAARQGGAETVRTLLAMNADINQQSPADGVTPLVLAVINGHFDIAKEMLDRGADPNVASAAGVTPLYAVVNVQWAPKAFYPQPRAYLQQQTSYLQLMTALVDKGADPNARLRRHVWYSTYNFDNLRLDEVGATPFWRAAYASDVDAMKLLIELGADPRIPTAKPAGQIRRRNAGPRENDPSGLPPVPVGSPGIPVLQAAAGWGYGDGFAGNAHRFAPGGMMAAVKYLVEEIGVDVNERDYDGNTAVHQAAARGDNEMIQYLIARGADVTVINRDGQTTVDMANGPVQRIEPFPETIALLEKLGAKNNHKCISC